MTSIFSGLPVCEVMSHISTQLARHLLWIGSAMASRRTMTAFILAVLMAAGLSSEATAASAMPTSVADHFADEDDLFLAIYEHIAARTHGFDADDELRMAEAVLSASIEEGVDPFLVLAVISVESSFKRRQVSSAGAMGLMQVKPATAEAFASAAGVGWRGPVTLFDVDANVRIGTKYLSFKLQRFDGDEVLALAAYCHGPTRIRRILRADGALDSDHQRYSERVLRMYRHYRGAVGLPLG